MMAEGSALVTVVLSLLSGTVVGAIVTAIVTWKLGVRGHEREARKVELEAGDRFTGRLLERINQLEATVPRLEARIGELENKRREDAVTLREAGDHIDALEHHIYRQLPPPPPARPPGL